MSPLTLGVHVEAIVGGNLLLRRLEGDLGERFLGGGALLGVHEHKVLGGAKQDAGGGRTQKR